MKLASELGTCPSIGPEDYPELIYAGVRDLGNFMRLSYGMRDTIADTLERMERHFDIPPYVGGLEHELDPTMPEMIIYMHIDDLELAVVGLGCHTLDFRPEQADEVIPMVDKLLTNFDELKSQLFIAQ